MTSPRILPKAHTSWVRQSCFRPRCCGCQGPLSCTILVCWIASGLTWFHHNSIHPNWSKITQSWQVYVPMICGRGLCRCISFRCRSLVSCHGYLVCDACDLAKGAVDRTFVPNRSGKNSDGPNGIPKTCMFQDQILRFRRSSNDLSQDLDQECQSIWKVVRKDTVVDCTWTLIEFVFKILS